MTGAVSGGLLPESDGDILEQIRPTAVAARREAEEAQSRSEERLRLAVELAQLGTWTIDLETGVAELDDRGAEIVGLVPGETVDAAEAQLRRVHPDDLSRLHADLARGIESRSAFRLDYRVVYADGSVHSVVSHGRVVPETGQVLGINRDVTSERELEERQAFLLELSDALRPLGDAVEIKAAAARVVARVLGVNRSYYAEVEPDGDTVLVEYDFADGVPSLAGHLSMRSFGPYHEEVDAGRPVVIADVAADARLSEAERERWVAVDIRALAAVLIVKDGRLVALLVAAHREPREWAPADLALLEATAERTWAALGQARAEKALVESEERMRLALDAAGTGSFVWHPAEDDGEPDEQMLALFGLSPDSPLNLSAALASLIHPDDRERYGAAVAQAVDLAGTRQLHEEIRVVHPDGSEHWLAISAQVGFDGKAPGGRMAGVAVDITDRKCREAREHFLLEREQAARREAERRAHATAAFTFVSDGVLLADSDGVVRSWNVAAERITGLAADAIVGRELVAALPGWAAIAEQVPVVAADTREPPASVSLPLQLGERELWLSISATSFDGGVVYTLEDVSGERELERMRSDLIATVSHQLRTPLAAVYGAAVTLRRDDLDFDRSSRAQFLDMIETQACRLTTIVDEILAASRLDSGEVTCSPVQGDPVQLAREIADLARTVSPDAEVTLAEPLAPIPPAVVDAEKVRQVLRNLVDNAVRYSGERPKVDLRVETDGRHLRFSVADRGIGIALDEQRRVFDKFYRVDSSMSDGVGGTGLGLYICRELARRMNGRLWLESAPGKGSTFTLEVPTGPL